MRHIKVYYDGHTGSNRKGFYFGHFLLDGNRPFGPFLDGKKGLRIFLLDGERFG